jgi:hypothetical protein
MTAPPPGCVLALDLASITGWAADVVTERNPRFSGTWTLRDIGGEGARYGSFENELAKAIQAWRPAVLVVENPLPIQALMNQDEDHRWVWLSTQKVMEQQISLRAYVLSEGWRASVPVHGVDVKTVRSAVMGRANFPADTVKGEVVKFCRAHNVMVADHNQGDAVNIWWWWRLQVTGNGPRMDSLFGKKGKAFGV